MFEPDKKYDVSVCAVASNTKCNSDYSDSIYVTLESTEGLAYTLLEDGTGYAVSRGNISFLTMPETIIIKDTYNGLPVTEVKELGFGYVNFMQPEIINQTVKRVRLSRNTITLNKSSFFACSCLNDISLPETLETIGPASFGKCKSLRSITFPKSLRKIEEAAFNACGITEVCVPDVELGRAVFNNCTDLTKIVFDDEIETITSMFCYQDSSLSTVILPKKLKQIDYEAFRGCSALESVEIPDGVELIDEGAFYQCVNLSNINIPENLQLIYSTSVRGTKWLADQKGFVIINGILLGYGNMPENFELIIPDDVKTIPAGAFLEEGNLKSVYIPLSVESIGGRAFGNCENLETAVIDASISYLPDFMFYQCKNLKEVVLPSSVETIGLSAFASCENLEKINVSASLSEIKSSAFSGCVALKDFDFTNVKTVGSNAFFNCGIEKLFIYSDIFDDTFRSANLTTVFIGKNVTNMPKFNYCTNLKVIFYEGTAEEYQKILRENYEKNGTNNAVLSATVYYYSEEKPAEEGNYWHYVDGVPTAW